MNISATTAARYLNTLSWVGKARKDVTPVTALKSNE